MRIIPFVLQSWKNFPGQFRKTVLKARTSFDSFMLQGAANFRKLIKVILSRDHDNGTVLQVLGLRKVFLQVILVSPVLQVEIGFTLLQNLEKNTELQGHTPYSFIEALRQAYNATLLQHGKSRL